MQVLRLVFVSILGLFLTGFAFFVTNFIVQISRKVSHTKDEACTVCILTLISVITAISAVVFLLRAHPLWRSIYDLIPLLIMCKVAYFDTRSGRIPMTFFFISLLASFILGFQTNCWLCYLLGGLSNLIIGFLLYWFGLKYYVTRYQDSNDRKVAFGMGDVYAAGAMGALVAFPLSLPGLLIALIASLVIAVIQSLIDQQPLMGRHIRLGPGFLIATILLLLLF